MYSDYKFYNSTDAMASSIQIRDVPESIGKLIELRAKRSRSNISREALNLIKTALGFSHTREEERQELVNSLLAGKHQQSERSKGRKKFDIVKSISEDRSR